MSLAIRTGIPVSVWLAEDPRVIPTAFELLERDSEPRDRRGGPMMSG